MTCEVDMTGFNRAMGIYAYELGVTGPNLGRFVRKQAGELVKTLIRITPPSNPAKTRERLGKNVDARFKALSEVESKTKFGEGQLGTTGSVNWYSATSRFLFGVAPDLDMRGASAEALYPIFFRITPKGRLSLPFKSRRTSQRVLITQRILTKRATVLRLKARLIRHIGRLKAAWTPSWTKLAMPGSPGPKFVTRHTLGARGDALNNLDQPMLPTFTMINRAKGINGKDVPRLLKRALDIRTKAMLADLQLYIRGVKERAQLGF